MRLECIIILKSLSIEQIWRERSESSIMYDFYVLHRLNHDLYYYAHNSVELKSANETSKASKAKTNIFCIACLPNVLPVDTVVSASCRTTKQAK